MPTLILMDLYRRRHLVSPVRPGAMSRQWGASLLESCVLLTLLAVFGAIAVEQIGISLQGSFSTSAAQLAPAGNPHHGSPLLIEEPGGIPSHRANAAE